MSYELPISITIGGNSYPIRRKGDYRIILDCFIALNDSELSELERVYSSLIIFYDGFNSPEELSEAFGDNMSEAIEAMYTFFNCGEDEPTGTKVNFNVFDWDTDSQLVCSAVNDVAHTEIRLLDYLHWWTFYSYYMAISGECLFSTVVSLRTKIAKGEKKEKWENKFIEDNPKYFNRDYRTADKQALDEYVKSLWSTES